VNPSPSFSPIELQIAPASSALPSSDQRWQNQVAQLLGELKRNAGEVRKEITPVPGQKGGAEAIILALGSSGAIAATVTIIRAWLARAADRSIRMKGKMGDKDFDIEITGANVSESTVQLLAKLAGK
jgi:hypothetical protein